MLIYYFLKENGTEDLKLLPAQKARIERNRQKALLFRQARLMNQPILKIKKMSGIYNNYRLQFIYRVMYLLVLCNCCKA